MVEYGVSWQSLFAEATRNGNWNLALRCIRAERDEDKRSSLVYQYLKALEERGEKAPYLYREVIKILRPIRYSYEALRAYRLLIDILVKLRIDVKPLLGRLKGLVFDQPSGSERASYLAPLARLLTVSGYEKEGLTYFDLAIREAERELRADTRAYTLSVIAYSMIQANLVEKAFELFRRAEKTVEGSKYFFDIYREKTRIASYLYSLGLRKEGRKALMRAFLFLREFWYEKEVRRYLWYIINEFKVYGEEDLEKRAFSYFQRLYY